MYYIISPFYYSENAIFYTSRITDYLSSHSVSCSKQSILSSAIIGIMIGFAREHDLLL